MRKNSSTKNLLLFILIAYGFSWAFWIPKAMLDHGLISNQILLDFLNSPFNPGPFGPMVAAFVMVYLNSGKEGLKKFLKRGINFKFNKAWLLPTLLLMPLIAGVALILPTLSSGVFPKIELFSEPWMIIYWIFYILLLGGPLQEEFGWRGYALDILQSKNSALKSSLILGVIWAFWHLPLNFIGDVGPQYSLAITMLLGSVVTMTFLSIIMTWLYNNTNRSILVALLFHASINFSAHKLFPVFENQDSLGLFTLFLFVTAIVVTIIWKPKYLSKKPIAQEQIQSAS